MIEPFASKVWDVVVIGGGPAGMIAAGRAAERGLAVLLLEKNSKLGNKLLITGGGRCNVTNNKPEINTLVASYKNSPKQLYSIFSQFGVAETLEFFHARGMETKIEAEGRIFPTSNKAESVLEVLLNYIVSKNVHIQKNTSVLKLSVDKDTQLIHVHTKNKIETTQSCIVAVGGTSHPETGSTGDGFRWLQDLGHTIIKNTFSLVPVALKNSWVKNLAGVTLHDIKISIVQNGKRHETKKGKLLFTHFGMSGPTVLNMSSTIGDLLQYGGVTLELDLLPEFDYAQLKTALHTLLTNEINKKIKNSLDKLIPSALVGVVLNHAQVDSDKANHSITRAEKVRLMKFIKAIPLEVTKLLGEDKAIVSAGGVRIEEVNFKTMESRIVPNLYIVGDMLNIDRPSGGYSLQLCWSSGYVAGNNCKWANSVTA